MNQDQIDKVETLIGYLEYFLKRRTAIENSADEILAVVREAEEWIADERDMLGPKEHDGDGPDD